VGSEKLSARYRTKKPIIPLKQPLCQNVQVTMMSKRAALMELRSGYRNKNHAAPEGRPVSGLKILPEIYF
jgi:hypothetical protein